MLPVYAKRLKIRYYYSKMHSKQPAPQLLDFSAYQTPLSWLAILKHVFGGSIKGWALFSAGMGVLILAVVTVAIAQSIRSGEYVHAILVFTFFFFIVFAKVTTGKYIGFGFARAKQALRLHRFALANGFGYQPSVSAASYPGLLFTEGNHRSSFDTVVSGTYQGLPFQFGNATLVTGSGRSETRNYYGIICVSLSRRVPHVLLDSKHNNSWGMSNFVSLKRSQRLRLEGDFNKYFDLYVPQGYERDALYFLTPELMSLLIDSGAQFDVELVDNQLFIYSSKPFKLQSQEAVQRIFELIRSIGGEFHENTIRYADANIGDRRANIVADPGKRLKKSWPWVAIIVIVVYILLVISE